MMMLNFSIPIVWNQSVRKWLKGVGALTDSLSKVFLKNDMQASVRSQ
jgi:hypothetical protein